MASSDELVFVRLRGIVQGPYTREQLKVMLRRGLFSRVHEISLDGKQWSRSTQLEDFWPKQPAIAPQPIPKVDAPPQPAQATEATQVVFEDAPMVDEWYIARGESQEGPFFWKQLCELATSGTLLSGDLVWSPGMESWGMAGEIPVLCDMLLVDAQFSPFVNINNAATVAQPKHNSTLATISLVFGILGWSLLPIVGSIVAIVVGHMALSEIRRSNHSMSGSGLAVSGLVAGYSAVTVAFITAVTIIFLSVL